MIVLRPHSDEEEVGVYDQRLCRMDYSGFARNVFDLADAMDVERKKRSRA